MDNKHKNRYEELQPNSAPREEMLIVFEYLNNYAYDEKHASTQVEIVEYAKKTYNIDIRRDRVGQILIHLEQISKKSPQLLPFKLKSVELNAIKKYYVPQRTLPEKDVVNILQAIKNCPTLSKRESRRLYSRFLDLSINRSFHDDINEKVDLKGYKVKYVDNALLAKREQFEQYAQKQTHLLFKLKNIPDSINFSTRISWSEKEHLKEPDNLGFVANVYTIGNESYAVMYMNKYKLAFICDFEDIEVLDEFDISVFHSDKITYELVGKYQNINAWLEDHFKGKDGFVTKFKCKVTINDETFFNKFKRAFEDYWDKELTYTVEERNVQFHYEGPNGEDEIINDVAQDAIFEIEANEPSFRNWYINYGNFDTVVILEPGHLNDWLLGEKIERYAKRLTKYGKQYNYSIQKEIKPEYAKLKEESEKRREELLKRREERRKRREEFLSRSDEGIKKEK